MKVSIFLISFFGTKREGSNSLTSAAIREVNGDGSNRVIGPTPFFPARSASQFASFPIPTGETRPIPVTATRRGEEKRGMTFQGPGSVLRGILLDVGDGVFDFLDLLGGLVRNLDVERLFESHHELHRVKRIRPEVVHEGSFRGDLVRVHAELLDDDALDLIFHAHSSSPFFSDRKPPYSSPLTRPGASLHVEASGHVQHGPRDVGGLVGGE